MTFIEFIGFIITMIALFFLMMKRAWEERYRREHPEEFEEEEAERKQALREFLQELDIDIEDLREEEPEPEPPPPPPTTPVAEEAPPPPILPAFQLRKRRPKGYRIKKPGDSRGNPRKSAGDLGDSLGPVSSVRHRQHCEERIALRCSPPP